MIKVSITISIPDSLTEDQRLPFIFNYILQRSARLKLLTMTKHKVTIALANFTDQPNDPNLTDAITTITKENFR